MTPRRRKPPTEPPTPMPEAEPESLPLPFDDSDAEPTRENPLVKPVSGTVDDIVAKGYGTPIVTDTFTSTLDDKLEVTTEWVRVGDAVSLTTRDRACAVIDEYVARCTSGESLSLADMRELRKRVAAL